MPAAKLVTKKCIPVSVVAAKEKRSVSSRICQKWDKTSPRVSAYCALEEYLGDNQKISGLMQHPIQVDLP
jgi:hypothetical protein